MRRNPSQTFCYGPQIEKAALRLTPRRGACVTSRRTRGALGLASRYRLRGKLYPGAQSGVCIAPHCMYV
jgi:hypothetical protein